jgi:hypothetical protein
MEEHIADRPEEGVGGDGDDGEHHDEHRVVVTPPTCRLIGCELIRMPFDCQ